MYKNFKFRLYPNEEKINKSFIYNRIVYNYCFNKINI